MVGKRCNLMTRLLVGVVVAGLLVPVGAEAQNDGDAPTIEEPAGLDRERWEALVLDAWENYPGVNQTLVLPRERVPTIRICMQSPDESKTGERLAPYATVSWWREQIAYWTGYCQVDEKLVDRPPRYWARASREPAMLGIKSGRRSQLDNTSVCNAWMTARVQDQAHVSLLTTAGPLAQTRRSRRAVN